jgi:uncharacterized SAM-binding protein YcdF (DUF218 family)
VTIAILHHAGALDLRVPSTVALARQHPDAVILLGLPCPDADALRIALGHAREVRVRGHAVDTVGEVTATYAAARCLGVTTLYVSTEPGHLFRAALIARLVYLERGVRVIPWPSAMGAYRSPWLRTVRDACRALWHRMTTA